MTFTCDEIQEMLPAYAGGETMTLSVRRHLSRCDSCSRELERYGVLSNLLGDLRTMAVDPPPELLPALLRTPVARREVVVRHVSRNRRAYAGGALALLGAAGAVALAARSRRVAPA